MYHALKQHFLRFMPVIKEQVADVYGRVVLISDAPVNGQPSGFNRPGLSASIQILTLDGKPNTGIPVLPSLPVPSTSLNIESVSVGDLVLVGFVFGSPRHPVIKAVYPNGSLLPGINSGEQWQGDSSTFQHINSAGIFREALNEINDKSFLRTIKAHFIKTESAKTDVKIKGLWSATVGALLFKSFGSLRLLAGSVLNISALGNINIRTKKDLEINSTGDSTIKAKGLYIGTKDTDLITQVEALAAQVSALDDLVKAHVHPTSAPGAPTSAILVWVGVKAAVDAIKTKVTGIKISEGD